MFFFEVKTSLICAIQTVHGGDEDFNGCECFVNHGDFGVVF